MSRAFRLSIFLLAPLAAYTFIPLREAVATDFSPSRDMRTISRTQGYSERLNEANRLLSEIGISNQSSIAGVIKKSLPELVKRYQEATQSHTQIESLRQSFAIPQTEQNIIQAIVTKNTRAEQQIAIVKEQLSKNELAKASLLQENERLISRIQHLEKEALLPNLIIQSLQTLGFGAPDNLVANITAFHIASIQNEHVLHELRNFFSLRPEDNSIIASHIKALQNTAKQDSILINAIRTELQVPASQDLSIYLEKMQTYLLKTKQEIENASNLLNSPVTMSPTEIGEKIIQLQSAIKQKDTAYLTLQQELASKEKVLAAENEKLHRENANTTQQLTSKQEENDRLCQEINNLKETATQLNSIPPASLNHLEASVNLTSPKWYQSRDFWLGAGAMGATVVSIGIVWKIKDFLLYTTVQKSALANPSL